MVSRFELKPLMLVFTLVFMSLFVVLGIWQLHRYAFKQRLLENIRIANERKPISWLALNALADKDHAKVRLQGKYDNAHMILVARLYHGRSGYDVMTPFLMEPFKQWILVDRGWLAVNPETQAFAHVPSILGQQTILGTVKLSTEQAFILGKNVLREAPGEISLQRLEWPEVERFLGQPLKHWVVRLDSSSPYGFDRHWPVMNMLPQRHLAYAVQWFLMTGALLIAFVLFSIRKRDA